MAIEVQTNLALEAEPVAPKHVVNIEWVTQFFAGRIKMPVRLAATSHQAATYATATHTYTYDAMGHVEIDDVLLAVGDRVLLAGQTPPSHNGIYECIHTGSATTHGELRRTEDFNDGTKIFDGLTVAVNDGTEHGNRTFKLTCDEPVILDTTALHFTLVTTPTTGARKFAEDIDCDGTEHEWEIEHNFGTDDVVVEIWNRVTKGLVMAEVEITDDDTVTVKMDQPPDNTKRYRVVVVG